METQTTPVGTRIIGNASEAEAWILESGLAMTVQEPLLRFVRRFSSLRFYKWAPGHTLPGPAELRAIWSTFYNIHTDELRWMQFDTPDPYTDIHETPADRIWYHVVMDSSPSSEYECVFMDEHELLFIGYWEHSGESTYYLALKADDEQDQRIYALNYEDITIADDDMGRIAARQTRPAFDSYADMLGHITALKLGQAVITAEK